MSDDDRPSDISDDTVLRFLNTRNRNATTLNDWDAVTVEQTRSALARLANALHTIPGEPE